MRIAFLTTEYPTEETFAGGIASNTQRTAHLLASLGHEVEVFTLSNRVGSIGDGPVQVHRVILAQSAERLIRRLPFVRRWLGYTKVMNRSWKLAHALRKRHLAAPFDIVQAASNEACGLVAAIRPVAPVVTFVGCFRPRTNEKQFRKAKPHDHQLAQAEFAQMRRSAAVYAPSKLVAGLVEQTQGIATRMIEYAYDLDAITNKDWQLPATLSSQSFGLFFGTLNRLKGCDRLVDVLPSLLDRNPGMRFVFVGQAHPYRNGLKFDEYINQAFKRYAGRVVYVPPQRQELLFPYVAHARFVVLPSRMDNMPNTCLEAMSLGRVVIGTRDASFEQLIDDGRNGFLVSQTDNDELAKKLEYVWQMDDTELARLGANARATLARFQPDEAVKPLLALYEEVIAKARSSRKAS